MGEGNKTGEPKIIYEDGAVLVIDKPAGLVVHPDGRSQGPFLTDWLLEKYPEISGVGEESDRPGIVHRLDKDTSGVMVVAKTQEAYEHLKSQFEERQVEKVYLALVSGNIKKDQGVIDKPIGKSKKDYRRRDASSAAKGELREAETAWEVLERLPAGKAGFGDYTLLEVRPKTGRTHQIRVHMQVASHPVVCDELYAPGKPCPLGLARLGLHAYKLTINLPDGGRESFEAPLPADMGSALETLREL